jgi:hypothetical protein
MRTIPLLWSSLLAAALLAGCADGNHGTMEPADDLGLEATDKTGIIRGVVFDEAILPLEGVHIVLELPSGGELSTTSRKDGVFGFEGLLPGTYFLGASHPGYLDTQQSVEVVAGDDSPPLARIRLASDPDAVAPYAVTFVFEGFIECSTPVFGVCGFVTDAAELGGIDNATSEESQIRYAVDETPTWVQSEMLWDATNEMGHRLALMYSYGDCGGLYCNHEVLGGSPLLLTADQAVAGEMGLGNGTELYIRVFSEGMPETQGYAGATLQQDIVVYTTVFYGYAPPPGWRFSEAGAEPPVQ